MSLTAWYCHLDADLAFLLPGKYLLQIEQGLPIYPLPVPAPAMLSSEEASDSAAKNSTTTKLALGLHWWRERWLAVLHPNAANSRFFALLHGQPDIISLGLAKLPEKISFTPEALQPVMQLLPAWRTAFPSLNFENYQQFCLAEISIHGQNCAVLDPQAFFDYWLDH